MAPTRFALGLRLSFDVDAVIGVKEQGDPSAGAVQIGERDRSAFGSWTVFAAPR
jgi:hypothetical protein